MTRFFMHACAFLLLLEWIRPLIGITNVGRLDIFVIFIGICFTLSFFQTKWQIPIKIVTILFIIHLLYYKNIFINPSWLTTFLLIFLEIPPCYSREFARYFSSFSNRFIFSIILVFECFHLFLVDS